APASRAEAYTDLPALRASGSLGALVDPRLTPGAYAVSALRACTAHLCGARALGVFRPDGALCALCEICFAMHGVSRGNRSARLAWRNVQSSEGPALAGRADYRS